METVRVATTAPRKTEDNPLPHPSAPTVRFSFVVDDDPDYATLFVIRESRRSVR